MKSPLSLVVALSVAAGSLGGAAMQSVFERPKLSATSTAADSIRTAGGVTAGSGSVAVIGTDGRIPGLTSTYLASVAGGSLTGLNATQVTGGTLPGGVFPSPLPAVSGVNLTGLNASNLGTGTVPPSRIAGILGAYTGGYTCDTPYSATTDLLVFVMIGPSGGATFFTESIGMHSSGAGAGAKVVTAGVRKGQTWSVSLDGGTCGIDVTILTMALGS